MTGLIFESLGAVHPFSHALYYCMTSNFRIPSSHDLPRSVMLPKFGKPGELALS